MIHILEPYCKYLSNEQNTTLIFLNHHLLMVTNSRNQYSNGRNGHIIGINGRKWSR